MAAEGSGTAYPRPPASASSRPFFPRVSKERRSRCPVLKRSEINDFLGQGEPWKHFKGKEKQEIAKRIMEMARPDRARKETDVTTSVCTLTATDVWSMPINLAPLQERRNLECRADIFDYRRFAMGEEGQARAREERPLILDFANKCLGGGAFGHGFVQEEQMVAQSLDFIARLKRSRDVLQSDEVILIEGMHFDAWWDRNACAKKIGLYSSLGDIQHVPTVPLSVVAADAINMKGSRRQTKRSIEALAYKLALVFAAAEANGSTTLYSGLLGGGAFRNNRVLVCLLHMLLIPADWPCTVVFHHPIFWAFAKGKSTSELEQAVCYKADKLCDKLRARLEEKLQGRLQEATLRMAIDELDEMTLPLSEDDKDLL